MGDEVREAESNIDADEDRTPLRNPKLRKHRSRDHSLIRLLNVDLKVLLGFAIIAFLIVLFMIHRLIIAVEHPQKPRVVTPFPAQRSLIFLSFKVITRRACIGKLIALTLILEFVRVLSEEMQTVHLFFYLADEDGNALSLSRETLNIRENSLLDDLEVHYSGFRTSHIHNLSDLVQQNLGAQFSAVAVREATDYTCPRTMIDILRISFRTDVAFISGTGVKDSRLKERLSSLTGCLLVLPNKKDCRIRFEMKLLTLLKEVSGVVQSFSREGVEIRWVRCDQDLKSIGNVMMSMSLTRTQHNVLDSESISTGKAAVASLLGGIGYFYGQSKISVPSNSNGLSGPVPLNKDPNQKAVRFTLPEDNDLSDDEFDEYDDDDDYDDDELDDEMADQIMSKLKPVMGDGQMIPNVVMNGQQLMNAQAKPGGGAGAGGNGGNGGKKGGPGGGGGGNVPVQVNGGKK
ncbi:unnamed protein product [Camellia sinensis]